MIHTHTDHSHMDSTMKPATLVERAKQLGAPAVVLSDHGVLTGVYEFMAAAEKNGVKGIPGVEAYVQEDGDVLGKRAHLLLIPTDYEGYKAIMRAVTKSNTRLLGRRKTPCMNMEILAEYFGPGSAGHGHVIGTSACVSGILSRELLSNLDMQAEREKLVAQLPMLKSPDDPAYKAKLAELALLSDAVKVLIAERDSMDKVAKRTYKAKEKALKALSGEQLETATAKLEEEKAESNAALANLPEIRRQLANKKKEETAARRWCKEHEGHQEKWRKVDARIRDIDAALLDDGLLYERMLEKANRLSELFGASNFYVELQYHGLDIEAYTMPLLARAAAELSLPLVACNDAHFAEQTADCVLGRKLVQAMRFSEWYPPQPDDDEYYIKTDEEMRDSLSQVFPVDTVEAAMEGIGKIVARCDVQMPKGTHLPQFKGGRPGESAETRLRRLAEEGIHWRYPEEGAFTEEHRARLEHELAVIEQLGFSGYLCIVQDFLDYGRKLGTQNEEGVGLGVGPGRGSAVGSLVCYLTGITSIDPVQFGLLFERFLNVDRVSMPDIDSDFGMEIRGKVIEYVKEKYGEDAVCCIMARTTMTAKKAVRDVARVLGVKLYGDATRLYDKGGQIANAIPALPGVLMSDVQDQLEKQFAHDEETMEIIRCARIVEGTGVNYTMHAAGVIISDTADIGEYIPLMYNTDQEQWVSQLDKNQAEKNAGLLKMDFLGLRTLNIITDTLRAIYRNHGTKINIEKIPYEENVFSEIFAAGRTNGVFQFEGAGMKSMLREFKPAGIDDLVLLVAAYRPGPMQYLPDVISNKHGKTQPAYIVDAMEPILAETYGKPIFQEQLMRIASEVAGFSVGRADILRSAMSKKNTALLAEHKDDFIEGMITAGAKSMAAAKLWEELLEFGKYAFNKSHAAGYALLAYMTGWLKYHYPCEFFTATLQYTPQKKLPMMLRDAKAFGLEITGPDLTKSDFSYTGSGSEIRIGLADIKSVRESARVFISEREKAPFQSFRDFLLRVKPRKNVAEAVIESGAADGFCKNRRALLAALPDFLDDAAVIRKKLELAEQLCAEMETATAAEQKKLQKRIDNAQTKANEYLTRYERYELPTALMEDSRERLRRELDLLGIHLSGNPLADYPDSARLRSCEIADAEESKNVTLCGLITDLARKNRASDGAGMAFFSLADDTSIIEVCCFTQAYAAYGDAIEEGAVVAVSGEIVLAHEFGDEEGETVLKVYADSITCLAYAKKEVVVSVRDIKEWQDLVMPHLHTYCLEADGYTLLIHDRTMDEISRAKFRVSEDVMLMKLPGVEVTTQ